ncbi:hypothetical protein [Anaerovorax odorimutans]|nr:hypothetical protein [Anaerovorax odorimutans]
MRFNGCGGIDDSLLFFFLLLVVIFCQPSLCGCNNSCNDNCCC